MEAENAQDPREARANALYWESDESVNQIADELEVSKGALYGMVRPLASGLSCPECGAEMEYPNRTARDRGFLTCPACGLEEDEASVEEAGDDAVGGAGPGPLSVPAAAPRVAGSRLGTERTAVGAALLAAAAGFILGRLSKRS